MWTQPLMVVVWFGVVLVLATILLARSIIKLRKAQRNFHFRITDQLAMAVGLLPTYLAFLWWSRLQQEGKANGLDLLWLGGLFLSQCTGMVVGRAMLDSNRDVQLYEMQPLESARALFVGGLLIPIPLLLISFFISFLVSGM